VHYQIDPKLWKHNAHVEKIHLKLFCQLIVMTAKKVFHFKLGSFSVMKEVHGTNTWPYLKLKNQLSFGPRKKLKSKKVIEP